MLCATEDKTSDGELRRAIGISILAAETEVEVLPDSSPTHNVSRLLSPTGAISGVPCVERHERVCDAMKERGLRSP